MISETYSEKARKRSSEYYYEQLKNNKNFFKEKRKIHREKYKKRHPDRLLHKQIRNRCKENNIIFTISVEDINDILKNHICLCCGISDSEIKFEVDRVNPKLGYVPGNIQRICSRCNCIKSNGTVEDFELIIKYIKEYSNDK